MTILIKNHSKKAHHVKNIPRKRLPLVLHDFCFMMQLALPVKLPRWKGNPLDLAVVGCCASFLFSPNVEGKMLGISKSTLSMEHVPKGGRNSIR